MGLVVIYGLIIMIGCFCISITEICNIVKWEGRSGFREHFTSWISVGLYLIMLGAACLMAYGFTFCVDWLGRYPEGGGLFGLCN